MTESSVTIRAENIEIPTEEGPALAGTAFRPDGPIRAGVLIAGGLGIRQRFYAPFATWLAGEGYLVITFDLRGMGASLDASGSRTPRGIKADMLGWARVDFAAAVEHLARLAGRDQVAVIGHSLGAHHAGMTNRRTQLRICKLVAVASGAGYWRDWAPPSKRLAPLMLHVAVPLLTPLFGYFPGARLRMVADLPSGVARQWSRWCRNSDFAWGAEPEKVLENMNAATFPITAFSFTDDDAMTEACTRKLLSAFKNAPSELIRVEPGRWSVDCIGHVGAFRRTSRLTIWPLIASEIQ